MPAAEFLLGGGTLADNQKYYYLKLKEDFFDGDEIKVLEGMKDGYKYSNLLLKLYLKSLKFGGALRLNELIPYNIEMISSITHFDIDTVRVGMELYKKLGLIEVLEDGTIYIMEIQNYIGKSTTEADRKRIYRAEIENQKSLISGQMSDKCTTNVVQSEDKTTPEIRDRDKSIDITPIAPNGGDDVSKESNSGERFKVFWKAYPKKIGKGAAEKSFNKYKPDDALLSEMVKAVETQKRSDQWQKDNGQYIPNPATWLNQKRWEDEPGIEGTVPKHKPTFDIDEYERATNPEYGGSDVW